MERWKYVIAKIKLQDTRTLFKTFKLDNHRKRELNWALTWWHKTLNNLEFVALLLMSLNLLSNFTENILTTKA